MHCPKCGQQQVSDEIRYCSRCGFLLTAVSAVVANNGEFPAAVSGTSKKDSPRRRGVKQGAFIFCLAFLVIPLLAMFHVLTGTEPFLAVGALILLVGGAFLRIAWALMFESSEPAGQLDAGSGSQMQASIGKKGPALELPGAETIPAAAYTRPEAGSWRTTNDLTTPGSVTDSTTKLLSHEQNDQ